MCASTSAGASSNIRLALNELETGAAYASFRNRAGFRIAVWRGMASLARAQLSSL